MKKKHCKLIKAVGDIVATNGKIPNELLINLYNAYYSIVPKLPERKCETCENLWRGEDHFRTPCIKYYGETYKKEREECINNDFQEWQPWREDMYLRC